MLQRKNKNKANEDFGPSKGLVRFMHKTVLFLLWPLRRLYITIPVLLLLFLAPTFMGVKPAEVHLWYWNKFKEATFGVSDKIISNGKNLAETTQEPSQPSNIERVVDTSFDEQQDLHRKMFEKAQPAEGPVKFDVLTQAQEEIVEVIPETSSPQSQAATTTNELGLTFLNTPKEISGEATIINANELYIGNEAIILYGIYVDPRSREGLYAKEFLEEYIDDNPVKCLINAYTKQGVATAVCYLNGESINHKLVTQKLSKDVALTPK